MKQITTYINEANTLGLTRRTFRNFSTTNKPKDMTVDNISSAIWQVIAWDEDRVKLYNKDFNTLKSVFKTLEKNEDTDEFYRIYGRIKRKANLTDDVTEEDVKSFIKDNDEELSKDKDLQKIEP